ncbi:TRAM domain-containing protein [Halobaculum magnesiiphilum]|uniref:TRAM domain-containing protein n=1 Tax=Halobaculum magnesiiphilum TaxID=1017351 RepID=A0A8T8WH87_9EURY|nr:TRAM domain-containing protein [Halobaculum magnesiiphilum]QZP39209.1 TRAM domain-containing protein [Halobaculum magnesiiphilum]
MEISDQLLSLYTGKIEETSERYVLEVPEHELDLGSLESGEVYRIAVLLESDSTAGIEPSNTVQNQNPHRQPQHQEYDEPPVEPGDERVVEIESTGEEGDGVAKVDRGYVVIVPEAAEGDRVRIELDTVRQNVGFADVVEYVD